MIPVFTWNDSFLTHLPAIDNQHHRLVEMINTLGELVMSAEEIELDTLEATRIAILDYAKVHFSEEESLMEKANLDSRHVDHHVAEHRAFLQEVLGLCELCDRSPVECARALVEYLMRWLACHILFVDQTMARQLHSIEAGLSPLEAFENSVQDQNSGTNPLLEAMTGLFYVVSDRNRDLRILNRELELRVKERTLELESANRQLQLLSTQDELTGLPNRRYANLSLNELWLQSERYSGSLSVLMLDADHFKRVNDSFGHAAGDGLLRTLARRLREGVRRSDIVCRLGGDEFLVICPHSKLSGAADVARKILSARQPFCTEEGVECWDGGLSIGVAEVRSSMDQPSDLIQAADEALYTAKRQGGACMALQESD